MAFELKSKTDMTIFGSKRKVKRNPALKITVVQRSNTAENRSLNAQDGVTPFTLNAGNIMQTFF